MKFSHSHTLRWIFVVCFMLAIILIPFFLFEEALTGFVTQTLKAEYSRLFIAICAVVLLAFDVLLPIPSSLLSTLVGGLMGFFYGIAVVWSGMTAGCVIAYWIGANAGGRLVEKLISKTELDRARMSSGKIGFAVLTASRGVPVMAEVSTIAAGMFGYPFRKFMLITSLGNLAIATVYTGIGVYAFEVNAFLLSFFAAILLPVVFWLIYRVYTSKMSAI